MELLRNSQIKISTVIFICKSWNHLVKIIQDEIFPFPSEHRIIWFSLQKAPAESSNKVACLTGGIFEVSVTMFQRLAHKKRYKEKIGKYNKERPGLQCSNN